MFLIFIVIQGTWKNNNRIIILETISINSHSKRIETKFQCILHYTTATAKSHYKWDPKTSVIYNLLVRLSNKLALLQGALSQNSTISVHILFFFIRLLAL